MIGMADTTRNWVTFSLPDGQVRVVVTDGDDTLVAWLAPHEVDKLIGWLRQARPLMPGQHHPDF